MNLYNKLVGELIGLARATDGNEHLITPNITKLIRQCLGIDQSDEMQIDHLITEVIAAKRELVPDCFYCANPCGRTNSYDMDVLKDEPELIQKSKKDILEKLKICHESTTEASLYRGLIAVGLDGATSDFLNGIAEEIH